MLHLAQDMLKRIQDRFRTTVSVVADLAESVGVPPKVTSLIHDLERFTAPQSENQRSEPPLATQKAAQPSVESSKEVSCEEPAKPEPPPERSIKPQVTNSEKKRVTGKKRGLVGNKDLSKQIRMLKTDDAINGSTYLARIIWSLGVANLEEIGSLRPADIARMIMSRTPVTLEPPNVARYIRRSQPTSITITHTEGNSNFYKLNDEGLALFNEKFRIK